MCDLICDIITSCVRRFNVGEINASDKIMFKDQQKRKYGNKRNFYVNLHLKDCFGMEFTAC